MLSVALFTYSVKPRGSVVHAACLAEALKDAGAKVTLYALAKGTDRFFRPLRVPLVRFPAAAAPLAPNALIAQRIGELRAGLERIAGRHDVYHAEDCLTASALVAAGAGVRPVVRTVHHVERFENPYLAECQRRSIERADLVLSVSERTRREVFEGFQRDSRVVHNGVDHARFEADPLLSEPALKSELGIRDGELVVLSVGGVEDRKNTLRSLDAVIRVCQSDARVRFVVAGGASIWDHSELEQRFDERVASLPESVRRRIVRVGTVDEATLTWLYRRSDVLLAAALHEGFGLSVLEGMAAHTAVICSKREPFTEFVDERSACLVDPESVDDITRALVRVVSDAALRARLGRAGRIRARAFSWQRTAREHLEAYRLLLAPPDRREPAPAQVPGV
jgi:glycosyltransferase-like protein